MDFLVFLVFHVIVVARVVVGLAGFFSETHVGLGEIFFTFLLFLRYELEAGVWFMADLDRGSLLLTFW